MTNILTNEQLEALKLDTFSHRYQAPTILQRAAGFIAQLVNEFNIYADPLVVFDVSSYQGTSGGDTGVDVDKLADYPNFKGMYFKMGEVGPRGASFTTETDAWMDLTFMPNYNKMLNHPRLWRGAYQYHNSTWNIDRGNTDGYLDDLFKGNSDDEIAMKLCQDPNIYLWVRRLKRLGRVWTAAQMKAGTQLVFDCLMIDFEKWYNNRGLAESDYTLYRALMTTIKGLIWLMAHGYLDMVKIEIYSSEWFLKQYANVYGRNFIGGFSCAAAGYYWNSVVKLTTWAGMLADIKAIPATWHPYYIGAVSAGERVDFLQISGDHFTIPEVCSEPGRRSAIDVNVFNGSIETMQARFPGWAARASGSTPPPPPPPPPPPTSTIHTGTAQGSPYLNIRTSPVAVPNNSNVVETFAPGTAVTWDSAENVTDQYGNEFVKLTLVRWAARRSANGTILIKE